jgi:uncharacterized membrane protein
LPARWESDVDRWSKAGVIDAATAARIRAFEEKQETAQGFSWPVLFAIAFGGLLLGAGVLLFVAAHWDALSPGMRFDLVLFLVAAFHVAGAVTAQRFSALSTTLHAVGTICLGAGIFLAGQIFNLQEHWPGGIMLWAIGAWVGFALLRDWPQAGLAAILTPFWLFGEWVEATQHFIGAATILVEGSLLLSITYLTARPPGNESVIRKTLVWIGALYVLPLAASVPIDFNSSWHRTVMPSTYFAVGWLAALLLPLLVAWRLRGWAVWLNLIAALWVVALGSTGFRIDPHESALRFSWRDMGPYLMWALGSIGLIAWGLYEARKERINLGVAGFALTVLAFYFSTVMDKLGRSASLIGMGLLFLLGGWLLEKTRRRLVAKLENDRA